MRLFARFLLSLSLLASAACGDSDPPGSDPDAGVAPDGGPAADAGPDETDELFDPETILEVEITLDPDDWDALRNQTRTIADIFGGDCLAQPFPSPFTYFSGD